MKSYEILYIVRNDIDDETKLAIVDKFSELVTSLGGTVDSVDKWGTKKFAYTIGKTHTEGYYVLMLITADANAPAEIDRNMRNDERVLRCMITVKS